MLFYLRGKLDRRVYIDENISIAIVNVNKENYLANPGVEEGQVKERYTTRSSFTKIKESIRLL
jgi:hypothetical protein